MSNKITMLDSKKRRLAMTDREQEDLQSAIHDNEHDNVRIAMKNLHGKKKAEYIFDYYRIPILIAICAVIFIVGYVYKTVTAKETVLTVALVNVTEPNAEFREHMTEEFLPLIEADPKKKTVDIITGIYVTDDVDDPNYKTAYTSVMKLMAMVNAQEVDVVIANRDAAEILTEQGYFSSDGEMPDPAAMMMGGGTAAEDASGDSEAAEETSGDSEAAEETSGDSEDTKNASGNIEDTQAAADEASGTTPDLDSSVYDEVLQETDLSAYGYEEPAYTAIIGNTPHREAAEAFLRYIQEP